ncbi:hypothetical protein ACS3SW_00930 [Roseobacteraceae bacterium S113]
MWRVLLISVSAVGLAGCGAGFGLNGLQPQPQAPASNSAEAPRPKLRPVALQTAPVPAASARTAEEFDTTTSADRQAAATVVDAAEERALGTSVVSLGSPADPGFWMSTPLVTEATPGRVVYQGKSANVELRPAEEGAGARLSLAAMRLIEAPLTDLPEVEVFAN